MNGDVTTDLGAARPTIIAEFLDAEIEVIGAREMKLFEAIKERVGDALIHIGGNSVAPISAV